MASGDDQPYQLTVGDIRNQDAKFDKIFNEIATLKSLLKPKTIVVDNSPTGNWNWRNAAIVIGSIIVFVVYLVDAIRKLQ